MNHQAQDPALDRNDEPVNVALSHRDARAAVQLLSALIKAWDRASSSSPNVISTSVGREELIRQAKGILQRRRQRSRQFGNMFGEPAWDMLLVLYTEEHGNRIKVSRLVDLSGVPATTGLRWLDYLEFQQLVSRRAHPTDGRSFFVELTDKGREALDSYFSETLRTTP